MKAAARCSAATAALQPPRLCSHRRSAACLRSPHVRLSASLRQVSREPNVSWYRSALAEALRSDGDLSGAELQLREAVRAASTAFHSLRQPFNASPLCIARISPSGLPRISLPDLPRISGAAALGRRQAAPRAQLGALVPRQSQSRRRRRRRSDRRPSQGPSAAAPLLLFRCCYCGRLLSCAPRCASDGPLFPLPSPQLRSRSHPRIRSCTSRTRVISTARRSLQQGPRGTPSSVCYRRSSSDP